MSGVDRCKNITVCRSPITIIRIFFPLSGIWLIWTIWYASAICIGAKRGFVSFEKCGKSKCISIQLYIFIYSTIFPCSYLYIKMFRIGVIVISITTTLLNHFRALFNNFTSLIIILNSITLLWMKNIHRHIVQDSIRESDFFFALECKAITWRVKINYCSRKWSIHICICPILDIHSIWFKKSSTIFVISWVRIFFKSCLSNNCVLMHRKECVLNAFTISNC